VLLKKPGLAASLLALGVGQPGTPSPRIEHTPPACFQAEKPPRLVACLAPRLQKASLRVFFRAEGGVSWYAAALRSDVPCYSGLLPRPSRATTRVVYFIEAEDREGGKARTEELAVAVVTDPAACPGRVASTTPGQGAAWTAPAGGPRVPPGFEGTAPPASAGRPPAPPPAVAHTPPATAPSPKGPAPAPTPPRTIPPPATTLTTEAPKGGGHGLRNTALVAAGLAAAGGGVVVATQDKGGAAASPPPTGTGLPASGVSGVYVGTESVNYSGSCVGTDDVVLNLQEAGGSLSGVLSFTVRTCPCCSSGRGANPVVGSLAGTSVQLGTPIGFSYSGSFAGNRLSGALAGPGGVTGTWSVDKR
jgi:hypothetical protein